MEITQQNLACLRELAPTCSEPNKTKLLIGLLDAVAAEKGWDISEIKSDPATEALALEQFRNGNYLNTEEFIAYIRASV
jgi:hypothetical protein